VDIEHFGGKNNGVQQLHRNMGYVAMDTHIKQMTHEATMNRRYF